VLKEIFENDLEFNKNPQIYEFFIGCFVKDMGFIKEIQLAGWYKYSKHIIP